MIMAAWFLAQIGPEILGVDLAAECRKYEEKQSGERKELFAAWRMFEISDLSRKSQFDRSRSINRRCSNA